MAALNPNRAHWKSRLRVASIAGLHLPRTRNWDLWILTAFLLLLGAGDLRGAPLAARWISPVDGDWDNPANWDIGRVPNNAEGETFVIFPGQHPVTIRVRSDVTVDSLHLAGGETLELAGFFEVDFKVLNRLEWTAGTVAGTGRLTANGYALLRSSGTNALTLRGGAELFFQDHCNLESILHCKDSGRIEVGAAGTLHALPGSGLLDQQGQFTLSNFGVVRIHDGEQPFSCPFALSNGEFFVGARTVEFPTAPADAYGIEVRDGVLRLAGAIIQGGVAVSGGALSGHGSILVATVEDEISGWFQFGELHLEEFSESTFVLGPARDQMSAQGTLNLSGFLRIDVTPGFVPGPNDEFELVRAEGGISGKFQNLESVPYEFGTRIPIPSGSALLELTPDSKAVWLRNFLPPSIPLGDARLAFEFPPAGNSESGGCFAVPYAAINLPSQNWAGGKVEVEITTNYDTNHDRLSFRTNTDFPESSAIRFVDLPAGEQTVLYRNTPFGTARIHGGQMSCNLYSNAEEEAVVALLGVLHYSNSQLTPKWFTNATDRYPQRTIRTTLTDGAGIQTQISRDVTFPHLVGISLGDQPLLLDLKGQLEVRVLGTFSDGGFGPMPQLSTEWRHGTNTGFEVTTSTMLPGQIVLRDVNSGASGYCVAISARAEPFSSEGVVYVRHNTSFGVCVFNKLNQIGDCAPVPEAAGTRLGRTQASLGVSLATFHTLEALMKESAGGRRLADLYRRHTAEVVGILLANPSLMGRTKQLIADFQPGVAALLAGRGGQVVITPAMIQDLNDIWTKVAERASPPLKEALLREQSLYDRFHAFANRDFARWTDLLALTTPTQPRIHLSGATRTDQGFSVEINDVPETTFHLWRSTDLKDWQTVSGADVFRDGFTLRFTDLEPPAERALYEVRQPQGTPRPQSENPVQDLAP